jgi:hypothetical protein
MLGTVREYARERLDSGAEATELRHRHAQYFLGLVKDNEPLSRGPAHEPWFERLDAEAGNLQAAAEWLAAQGDWNGVTEFSWTTRIYYWIRGNLRQVHGLLQQAYLHLDRLSGANRGRLLAHLASVSWMEGDTAQAERLAGEAVSVAEPPDDLAVVEALQTRVYIFLGTARLRRPPGWQRRYRLAAGPPPTPGA